MKSKPLRIGLAASRLYRTDPDAALYRLLQPLRTAIVDELLPQLHVVGQTYDAIARSGMLDGYHGMHRLPTRRDGGLIHLVAGRSCGATSRSSIALRAASPRARRAVS